METSNCQNLGINKVVHKKLFTIFHNIKKGRGGRSSWGGLSLGGGLICPRNARPFWKTMEISSCFHNWQFFPICPAAEPVPSSVVYYSNPPLKLCLHMRFQHAFTACACVFEVISLVDSNQRNYFENTNACSERMLKTFV